MTELIMSSVPRDKAGVGSAMNDTTREVGTTLGVAVLGSILSSGYTSQPRQRRRRSSRRRTANRRGLAGRRARRRQRRSAARKARPSSTRPSRRGPTDCSCR